MQEMDISVTGKPGIWNNKIFDRIYYYDGEVVGEFVADIIVDIGLLLDFG